MILQDRTSIKFKFDREMSSKNIGVKSRGLELKTRKLKEEPTPFTEAFFSFTSTHLHESTKLNRYMFYLFDLLEALSFLWFLLQPATNIYSKGTVLLN
jgi:hypothetical protein